MNNKTKNWNFDNSYAKLSNTLFMQTLPTKVLLPNILFLNNRLLEEMGLDRTEMELEEWAEYLSGNKILSGANPIAQAYAGHQFGHFNKLGDGRAILLGEYITPDNKRMDIQLKGAGPTPYSRNGDGRASLRSMLREYLISEAMVGLGIPCTRSLAVTSSGEKVFREVVHEGAILTRIAASHIRVGTFEYVRNFLPLEELQQFTNYVIERHYPELKGADHPALELLQAVMLKQVDLVVHWMRVGFIHGVLNTDNVSIAGETFDLGPCAFMNSYSPTTVFSSIDSNGRYAFGKQAEITHWNMIRLAEALLPLIDSDTNSAIELAKGVLNSYPSLFDQQWTAMMGRKIGFDTTPSGDGFNSLIHQLLDWMEENQADYTLTFLEIEKERSEFSGIYQQASFLQWQEQWKRLLLENGQTTEKALNTMQQNNPCFIPRNHQVEEALDQLCFNDNRTLFEQILGVMASPYQEQDLNPELKYGPKGGDGEYKTYCGT